MEQPTQGREMLMTGAEKSATDLRAELAIAARAQIKSRLAQEKEAAQLEVMKIKEQIAAIAQSIRSSGKTTVL